MTTTVGAIFWPYCAGLILAVRNALHHVSRECSGISNLISQTLLDSFFPAPMHFSALVRKAVSSSCWEPAACILTAPMRSRTAFDSSFRIDSRITFDIVDRIRVFVCTNTITVFLDRKSAMEFGVLDYSNTVTVFLDRKSATLTQKILAGGC